MVERMTTLLVGALMATGQVVIVNLGR
jgi:hypothetical protein